jgi:hypothetical protein
LNNLPSLIPTSRRVLKPFITYCILGVYLFFL